MRIRVMNFTVPFTACKKDFDIWYKKLYIRVALRAAKRLKT